VRVDGNDVLACLAVTRWALERARRGEGPALIEAYTYRMGAHTTSDDPSRYRHEAEVREWAEKDPISRLRDHLTGTGLADDVFLGAVDRACDAVTAGLRAAVRSMPDPDRFAIFENVYADGHALVDEERARFAAYQASFAEAEGV
ncbi:thiamine pyrophosphate-dependent enzyme, partial [Streptomyces sp. WG5]|uniref:thiamine pyrophosphate-dependent enzyme n=1 Tax=Streptomyces sp. WG5 TaxID=3417648 RepID=UPI003CFA0F52